MRKCWQRRVHLSAVLIGTLVLMGARTTPAWAAKDEAAAHYEKGTTEYDLAHYDEAIKEFEDAYRLSRDPILLFNIAQSHRRLGNLESSLLFYRKFQTAAPTSPLRPKVEGRIEETEKLIAQQKELKEKPPTEVEPVKQPEVAAVATTPPAVSKSPERHADRRGLRLTGYVLAGVGAASLAVGIGFGVKARSDSSSVENAAVFDPGTDSSGKRAETLQWVFLGAGAAVAAAGVVLTVYAWPGSTESSRVALAPVLTNSSWGATCSVRF